MLELYPDHCQIVRESLSGTRAIDEQTYASLAVLNERLQRTRKLGDKFANITFSPAVEQLRRRPSRVAIG